MAKILCVDDDPQVLGLMVLVVRGMGHDADKAKDVTSGRQMAQDLKRAGQSYDLIITDGTAPRKFDGAQWARDQHDLGYEVILVSGEDPAELVKYGVPILHKPFRVEELEVLITAALDRRAKESSDS